MDRTAAYEAVDGSSSLPEGTMEPWQRWSMRGTENPENEVRVLGAPPEYMVSVARMEEHRVVAPVAKGSIPFRHTGQWAYSSAAAQPYRLTPKRQQQGQALAEDTNREFVS